MYLFTERNWISLAFFGGAAITAAETERNERESRETDRQASTRFVEIPFLLAAGLEINLVMCV